MCLWLFLSFLIGWCVNDVNQMKLNSQPVQCEIKGIVHKNGDEWFITDSPVLKSCCQARPREDEVVYLQNIKDLKEKRLYTFAGVIQQIGDRKVFSGVPIHGGNRGYIPFFAILSGSICFCYFAAKKWGK
jgi:hypothetical protein